MWESLKEAEGTRCLRSDRLKVVGGWIVRTVVPAGNTGAAVAQTFVADPNHKWKLED